MSSRQSSGLFFLVLILGVLVFLWVGKDFYGEIKSKKTLSRAMRGDLQAVELLKQRAANGDVYAMFSLGVCYARGSCAGIEKDLGVAVELWRKVADRVPEAAFNVGLAYEKGYLGEVNLPMAVSFYRLAAEKVPAASFRLACLLEDSEPVEAFKLYMDAAQRDRNPLLAYRIGWLYYNGIGTPRSVAEAVKWFKRAAEDGRLADALFMLGYAHLSLTGAVSPSDRVVVGQWFLLAAEADRRYRAKVSKYLSGLSEQELQTARKMAASWSSAHGNVIPAVSYDEMIWTTGGSNSSSLVGMR